VIEDCVYGLHFRNLSDNIGPDLYRPDNNYQNIDKEHQTIYSGVEFVDQALKYIRNNADKKFTLITHNSDNDAEEQDIPYNLVHWYTQNLNFKHEKVSPLPIGFENPFWHPWKEEIILNSKPSRKRIPAPFAQFNPVTNKQDRGLVLNLITRKQVTAYIFNCINGQNFETYVENMNTYTYCLCPRGNGIDTHRIWEALYFGCIPIVKRHITHEFEHELPIIFVDDWEELDDNYISKEKEKLNNNFDSPILSMKYWADKIYKEV
jgi:hypothetical protein